MRVSVRHDVAPEGLRHALESVRVLLVRVGATFGAWPRPVRVLVLFAVLLVQTGVDFETQNTTTSYLPASQALPRPIGFYSVSLGNLLLANLLRVHTVTGWMALHLVLTAAVLLATLTAVDRRARGGALALVLAASPATTLLLLHIGRYDPITYLGAVLLVLAGSDRAAIVGAVIMALGNPEQAVLAALALLALTHAPQFRQWRHRARTATIAVVVAYVLGEAWMLGYGVTANRLTLLPLFLMRSLAAFAIAPKVSVWSWQALLWVIDLIAIVATPRSSRRWTTIALVGLPAIAAFLTLDGARVFALVSLPVSLVVGLWLIGELEHRPRLLVPITGAAVIAVLLVPATVDGWGAIGSGVSGALQAASPVFNGWVHAVAHQVRAGLA